MRICFVVTLLVALAMRSAAAAPPEAKDALPSWNEGPTKQAILTFVARVTAPGSPDFVAPIERIATFDNDGTLWCEQPLYVQCEFMIARVKQLSREHPEWVKQQPYQAILTDDRARLANLTERDLVEVVMVTHAGVTTAEFDRIARDWLATAEHPRFKRRYTQLVYQPMLELLAYLRAHEFKTFIVSGGGVEFMRVFADQTYGIPAAQIVGSSVQLKYELRNDRPALLRLPKVDLIDNGPGKPIGIQSHIGRRPIAAFGNSDGDIEMLQWTTLADGPRLGMLVHHTDAEREYAYDRHSLVGTLDRGLDQAKERGWVLIDMKRDWKTIFPAANN